MTDHTVKQYITLLASDAPAPGGGAAASLCGAMGIALVSMVANLTTGKKKYTAQEPLMQETLQASEKLIQAFLDCMEADVSAFQAVSDSYKLPKETGEEKKNRSEAIQKALKGALLPPYQMMELSLESLEWAKKMVGTSNTNVASDIGVAAVQLEAAAKSGWFNVLINLNSIQDQAFTAAYRKNGEEMLKKASELSLHIYSKILDEINA